MQSWFFYRVSNLFDTGCSRKCEKFVMQKNVLDIDIYEIKCYFQSLTVIQRNLNRPIVTVLLSVKFGNSYLKIHIFKLCGFRVYARSLRYSNIYYLHKTSKKDIQYLNGVY